MPHPSPLPILADEEIYGEVVVLGLRESESVADRALGGSAPHDPGLYFQGPTPRPKKQTHRGGGRYFERKFCDQAATADVPDHPCDLLPGELLRSNEHPQGNGETRKSSSPLRLTLPFSTFFDHRVVLFGLPCRPEV